MRVKKRVGKKTTDYVVDGGATAYAREALLCGSCGMVGWRGTEHVIHGVAGVVIWTDELERLLTFYRDILGLQLHSLQPGFAAFRFGDVRLSVGVHSQVSGPSRDPHRVMVNLAVSDIHTVYRELAARGVEFVRPPEPEHWGGWVATLRDPDGNLLQLLQQASG